jgi:hypothetical protein
MIPKLSKPLLEQMTVPQLKQKIREHNLHTAIRGYSKMKKRDLVAALHKHIQRTYKVRDVSVDQQADDSQMIKYAGIPALFGFGALYLLDIHKNDCLFFMPPDPTYNKQDTTQMIDVNAYIDQVTYRDAASKRLNEVLQECSKPIVAFLVAYRKPSGGGHANCITIIKDPHRKDRYVMERYEPHGVLSGSGGTAEFEVKFKQFSLMLGQELSNMLNVEIEYAPPESFCPVDFASQTHIGLQTVEGRAFANLPKDDRDPGGYCAIWSLLFLDWRLSHPYADAGTITSTLWTRCEKEYGVSCNNYLRRFIRGYTRSVLERLIVTLGMQDRRTKSGAKAPRTPGKTPIVPVETAGVERLTTFVTLEHKRPRTVEEEKEFYDIRREIAQALERYAKEIGGE